MPILLLLKAPGKYLPGSSEAGRAFSPVSQTCENKGRILENDDGDWTLGIRWLIH